MPGHVHVSRAMHSQIIGQTDSCHTAALSKLTMYICYSASVKQPLSVLL